MSRPARLSSATATRAALALLLVAALAGRGEAQTKIGIGIFAPDIPFSGPAQRYAFIQGLARHLSSALGVPVTGRAFKRASDFNRARRAKQIDAAVVGGLYYAARRPGRVLAVGRLRSSRAARWSIMAKSKAPIASFKGKTLQLPALGPLTRRFVQYGMLGGMYELKKHFRLARAPDVTSAIASVRFGRAAAVVAPISTPGLRALVGAIQAPPPAFALLNKGLPKSLVNKLRAAVRSYGAAAGNIVGWRGGGAAVYARALAAASKRTYRMVMVPTPRPTLKVGEIVDTRRLKPTPPPLEDLFWLP